MIVLINKEGVYKMKIYKRLFLLSTSALLLASCSAEDGDTNDEAQMEETSEVTEEVDAGDNVQNELEKEIETLEKEVARLKEELEGETPEEVEDVEEETEETDASGNSGTRSQPMPVGETLSLSGTFTDRDADYEEFDANLNITILDTIRGDEAWDIIYNENPHNDPAPEGKEYIINNTEVKLYDATSEDLKTSIRSNNFDYISSEGASYNTPYVVLPDELEVELYNNGSATGNIVGLVDVGDNPLIRFENTFFLEAE